MRTWLIIIGIISVTCGVNAQSKWDKYNVVFRGPSGNFPSAKWAGRFAILSYSNIDLHTKVDGAADGTVRGVVEKEPPRPWHVPADFRKDSYFSERKAEKEFGPSVPNRNAGAPDDGKDEDDKKDRFHWKPALAQSLVFLGLQHGARMFQKKTTQELGGKFFKDWMQSVKNMRGWGDGDNTFTNYFAHPLQGSLTGRIFVNNSDVAGKQEFGTSKKYWNTRLRALAWSAVWSTQFELGPLSEASIGNVGLRYKNVHCTMDHVDLVVTPVVGTAVLVGEDAIDKYVLKKWIERNSDSKVKIRILRTLFTPTMSAANLLRGKMPWKRPERPL